MLSWAKQTTLLCWVYCNTPLRYAKVWLSFLIRQRQRHSINCDKLATRCQSRSATSENSDFCFFPWVWKSTKSGSCPYSKQLSNFQFASSGLWDPGSRLSKDKLFMFLHTPRTSLPCKEKYSLKWAICYFLAEDSSPLQKTAHPALRDLYWNGFFPPVNYIIFFSMIFLTILVCQWTWVFTTTIQYSQCTNECCLSQGISLLIWNEARRDIVNKGLGTEIKV